MVVREQPASPADEVRGMVVRRMSQQYFKHEKERREARLTQRQNQGEATKQAEMNKDYAMLDLQRRVEGELARSNYNDSTET